MAGNIPLVGFHDFLSVFISGHSIIGKLSSQDKLLMPAIAEEIIKIEPALKDAFIFTEGRLSGFDAVIATGSDNSSHYFDYYFGKYPHIIRKNRNSVALLTGLESFEELNSFVNDVLLYFGLGCRNVTKIYIPIGYDLNVLKKPFMNSNKWVSQHNKYMNNYDYQKSIMLINLTSFTDFDMILLREIQLFLLLLQFCIMNITAILQRFWKALLKRGIKFNAL